MNDQKVSTKNVVFVANKYFHHGSIPSSQVDDTLMLSTEEIAERLN